MTVNPRLVDLVIGFEGFGAKAYVCQGGTWTIGYGTTKWPDGRTVMPGDTITRDEAFELLTKHLAWVQGEIDEDVPKHYPRHVLDACTSLSYNIGVEAFRDSTCLKRLKAGNLDGAGEALTWWDKITKKDKITGKKIKVESTGLKARRAAERDVLLKGWDGSANSDDKAETIVESPPTYSGSRTFQGLFVIIAGLAWVFVQAAPEMYAVWEHGRASVDGKQGLQLALGLIPIAAGICRVAFARIDKWRQGQ
jgi:lysozyme